MKTRIFGLILAICGLSFMGNVLIVQPAQAACEGTRILTFPFWYRGVTKGDSCDIDTNKENFIGLIILNIGDILAQLAGYVSVAMIIYGGFKYITSTGTASGVESAKKTITNSIIGLVIAILAVAIVNVIFGLVK